MPSERLRDQIPLHAGCQAQSPITLCVFVNNFKYCIELLIFLENF